MDEFLVSGETIVRNLEYGQRRAAEFGGAMPVGYLPDMFGHVAQMPQILRQAGIDTAVVWRGVPAAIDSHSFEWESPDGSSVRAEYLPYGYGNGAYLLDVPGQLGRGLEAVRESHREFFGDEPILAMFGTDHMEPLPQLTDLLEESGAAAQVSTLPDYLATVDGRPNGRRWRGELRSSARANMLMGTLSARLDLKAAMARAERALTRYARAVPGAVRDRLAGAAARPRLAAADRELGARLDLRLLRGRGLHAGARPLLRGRADRHGPRRGRRARGCRRGADGIGRRLQPLADGALGQRRAQPRRPGPVEGHRARASGRNTRRGTADHPQRAPALRGAGAELRRARMAPPAAPRSRALRTAAEPDDHRGPDGHLRGRRGGRPDLARPRRAEERARGGDERRGRRVGRPDRRPSPLDRRRQGAGAAARLDGAAARRGHRLRRGRRAGQPGQARQRPALRRGRRRRDTLARRRPRVSAASSTGATKATATTTRRLRKTTSSRTPTRSASRLSRRARCAEC